MEDDKNRTESQAHVAGVALTPGLRLPDHLQIRSANEVSAGDCQTLVETDPVNDIPVGLSRQISSNS